jgi:hypothetical protein
MNGLVIIANQQITPFVVFLFIGVVIVVSLLLMTMKTNRAIETSFRRLADTTNGQFVQIGSYGYPMVRFAHRGAHGLLDVERRRNGKHRSSYTQVRIRWPNPQTRCEVYPQTFARTLGKFFGMEDIEIGYRGFDDRYMITGTSDEMVKGLLSPQVQQVVDQLYRLMGVNDIYVRFSGSEMLVKKRGLLKDWDDLSEFVRLSVELYDTALVTEATGIEFVTSENASFSEVKAGEGAPVCQICGDEIIEEQVECVSCKTPHHGDCWRYYGACSTYGCGEKQCK